jgi:transmembrane sensor
MQKRLTSQEVDDGAAHWASLVDARSLSEIEQAELDAWLEADTRHFGAFAKAKAVLAFIGRIEAPGRRMGAEGKQRAKL